MQVTTKTWSPVIIHTIIQPFNCLPAANQPAARTRRESIGRLSCHSALTYPQSSAEEHPVQLPG